MPNYRRAFVPGGCWFFTVNLFDRKSSLLVDHIDSLRMAVANTRRNRPFDIDAFVVLPDHLHAVWTLPPGDADFFNPLAAHQDRVCEVFAQAGMAKRHTRSASRAEHLAASVLGAP